MAADNKIEKQALLAEIQQYFENKINFYRQKLSKLDKSIFLDNGELPVQISDEKILLRFDKDLNQNKKRQEEIISGIITDYEKLIMIEKELFAEGKNSAKASADKNKVEDAKNKKILQLTELANSAENIMQQRAQHVAALQTTYRNQQLEASQKKLINMLTRITADSTLGQGVAVKNIQSYLKAGSSFTNERKLHDLVSIVQKNFSKDFVADDNSQLKNFYETMRNMKFGTQLDASNAIDLLAKNFPNAKSNLENSSLFNKPPVKKKKKEITQSNLKKRNN